MSKEGVIVTTHRVLKRMIEINEAIAWVEEEWEKEFPHQVNRKTIMQNAIDHFNKEGTYGEICRYIWKKHGKEIK